MVSDILLQGHLYITENYFAFHSNVFGYVTRVSINTIGGGQLEPICYKKQQKKSSCLVTGFWNRGPLKILNGIELILDDQGNHLDSNTISLESFRYFRVPLFCKTVTGQELFFAVYYIKPALAKMLHVYKMSSAEREQMA